MKLSIIVPCYNEADNLAKLLEAYSETVKGEGIEVILVDNGSTDDTSKTLEILKDKYASFLRILRVDVNQGYGHGIIYGLKEAKGEYIGWTHGDLQTPPKDVLTALKIIASYDYPKDIYIKGRRIKRPLFDKFFTFGMSIFETLYLKTRLYDINAQPNVFHRSFFEHWNNPPYDFSLDLYALYMAKQLKFKIVRFPVSFLPRQHGHSKWNTGLKSKWKFIKRTIDFSKLLKKQLR